MGDNVFAVLDDAGVDMGAGKGSTGEGRGREGDKRNVCWFACGDVEALGSGVAIGLFLRYQIDIIRQGFW